MAARVGTRTRPLAADEEDDPFVPEPDLLDGADDHDWPPHFGAARLGIP